MSSKIYFAAPLFTQAEIEFNEKVCNVLRGEGFEVFLPQENDDNDDSRDAGCLRRIYDKDISGVIWCDTVVAVIDGGDADSGTSFEMGYAKALGKRVIALRTDFRSYGDELVNLMLECESEIVRSVSELVDVLKK